MSDGDITIGGTFISGLSQGGISILRLVAFIPLPDECTSGTRWAKVKSRLKDINGNAPMGVFIHWEDQAALVKVWVTFTASLDLDEFQAALRLLKRMAAKTCGTLASTEGCCDAMVGR